MDDGEDTETISALFETARKKLWHYSGRQAGRSQQGLANCRRNTSLLTRKLNARNARIHRNPLRIFASLCVPWRQVCVSTYANESKKYPKAIVIIELKKLPAAKS